MGGARVGDERVGNGMRLNSHRPDVVRATHVHGACLDYQAICTPILLSFHGQINHFSGIFAEDSIFQNF